ncbi:COP9 signalosome complex subunit 8 [Galendromus occidentalis]|uniref:COP9 signalosome complex subunit 8 n=1 Tax=Galendromus occidentalis TaxID=34638 RepID=A0AAJ6QLW4_9ACAR|nr:COP9 signalosome complex subunit 8 [Galendromus occidentalis]
MLATEKPEDIRWRYASKLSELERLEVDRAGRDDTPLEALADMYFHLMAIYLIKDDLPNAKFVWKRAPDPVKRALPAFKLLHQVFLALWGRQFPAVYTALQAPWPPAMQATMDDLRSLTVHRATSILAKTYENVAAEDFCSFLGVNPPDVEKACAELGWRFEAGYIFPTANVSSESEAIPSEQQLAKLTDFVSFLEC